MLTPTLGAVIGAVLLLLASVAVAAQRYTNPVIATNGPDPGVLYHNGTYFMVTTSGDEANAFPIHSSPDLVTWTHRGHVFPSWASSKNPTWAKSDFWAPELHHISPGNFNVYFTARAHNGILSVGCARSSGGVLGPYKDTGAPLVQEAIGSIDATYFRSQAGDAYLVWKTDSNSQGKPTTIHGVRVDSETGTKLIGASTPLISSDLPWEGIVVEGPWIIFEVVSARYILTYSANRYDTADYALGVATSVNPLGPYVKHSQPILHTAHPQVATSWPGPGHCSLVRVGAPLHYFPNESCAVSSSVDPAHTGPNPPAYTYALVYHAWERGHIGTARYTLLDSVQFQGTLPVVYGGVTGAEEGVPSQTPKPIPRP